MKSAIVKIKRAEVLMMKTRMKNQGLQMFLSNLSNAVSKERASDLLHEHGHFQRYAILDYPRTVTSK